MEKGVWWATVHEAIKSQTGLSVYIHMPRQRSGLRCQLKKHTRNQVTNAWHFKFQEVIAGGIKFKLWM